MMRKASQEKQPGQPKSEEQLSAEREATEKRADLDAYGQNMRNSFRSMSSATNNFVGDALDKITGVKKVTGMDVMHEDAILEDKTREREGKQ